MINCPVASPIQMVGWWAAATFGAFCLLLIACIFILTAFLCLASGSKLEKEGLLGQDLDSSNLKTLKSTKENL
jgi:hypothetical protein